jgi:uncharacterized integral membrane protein
MRLLVILLTMLLLVNFIGFALTNLDTRVAVRVWKTDHDKVHLITVVFLSVLAGGVYVGAIGVAEGVRLRFENRRLLRDVQKLETELNFLRTQPMATSRAEPDAVGEERLSMVTGSRAAVPAPPASAPVYGAEDSDRDDEPGDDEPYTGGRAV